MADAMHGAHDHHEHTGHDHAGHDHSAMVTDFRRRFWISLVVTVPVLALPPLLQSLLHLRQALRFGGDSYVLFVLSAFVYLYGGWPFLKGIYDELSARRQHPIAQGVVRGAEERGVKPKPAEQFRSLAGQGAQAVVEGRTVRVVSPGYLR